MNKIVNGVVVEMSAEEIAQHDARVLAEQTHNAANNYKEERALAYPSIEDQLDEIFHNGIDSWKSIIQSVKDAHPKPE